jgi:hypothetical protein
MATADLSPQLAELLEQYDACSARATSVVEGLSDEKLARRPAPERWSIAECIAHLTLSNAPFPAIFATAWENARANGLVGDGPFKPDLIGRLLKWTLEPPPRIRIKARAPFQPVHLESPGRVLADFLDVQQQIIGSVRTAKGLRVDRVKVVSPVDARLKYNAFAALQIIGAHERRHLWQAERVRADLYAR